MVLTGEKQISISIFLIIAIVYLAFLTKNYYWDGIYFAYLIEHAASLDATLIHPNHPFYNPLGYLFYKLASAIGITARAVTVLQVVNCVLSALTSLLFFLVLKRCFRSKFAALSLT